MVSLLIIILWFHSKVNVNTDFENGTSVLNLRDGTDILSLPDKERRTVVIGIMSASKNICEREALRKTLIAKARAYKPLVVKFFFLVDDTTLELEEEQRVNQDIVVLNATVHGYGNFAERFYKWLRYVVKTFPDAILTGRMDDDVFLCAPQIFDRLNTVKDKLLYYGYPEGSIKRCPKQDRIDDMFLVVGIELARRVVNRSLCRHVRGHDCLPTGNAGHKFREWIKMYDDYVFVNERANGRMIWFWRGTDGTEEYEKYKTFNFCNNFLLFHKATISDIYDMDLNNSLLLNGKKGTLTNKRQEVRMKVINCTQYPRKKQYQEASIILQ